MLLLRDNIGFRYPFSHSMPSSLGLFTLIFPLSMYIKLFVSFIQYYSPNSRFDWRIAIGFRFLSTNSVSLYSSTLLSPFLQIYVRLFHLYHRITFIRFLI